MKGVTKEWFSCAELAGLDGMPTTPHGVLYRAKKEEWESRKRAGYGGGREFYITSLPPKTRRLLAEKLITHGMNEVDALLAMFNEAIARLEKFKEVMKGLSHE